MKAGKWSRSVFSNNPDIDIWFLCLKEAAPGKPYFEGYQVSVNTKNHHVRSGPSRSSIHKTDAFRWQDMEPPAAVRAAIG